MLIAGEPSGDRLAAELVTSLKSELASRARESSHDSQPLNKHLAPSFFGAGGPSMAAVGVDLEVDMMGHAVTGLTDVIKSVGYFRRLHDQLTRLAIERQPDVLICVDFQLFNRRVSGAVCHAVRKQSGGFRNWHPRIVQFVSPQVWASRPGRARKLSRELDLLLSIIPFEADWYTRNAPELNVMFVGNPIVDRYLNLPARKAERTDEHPLVALLPGSRQSELKRHLPPILDAVERIGSQTDVRFRMVLPNEPLLELACGFSPPPEVELQMGGLPDLLSNATLALASTGTVTMECAYFGVPTVAFYKTSGSNYQIGKRLITVQYMAMPNLIANEPLFPEFIQHEATGENLSRAALDLLNNSDRRTVVQERLREVVRSLGEPGAAARAAGAVLDLF